MHEILEAPYAIHGDSQAIQLRLNQTIHEGSAARVQATQFLLRQGRRPPHFFALSRAPCAPCAPCAPRAPRAPRAPCAPCAPRAPRAPCAPLIWHTYPIGGAANDCTLRLLAGGFLAPLLGVIALNAAPQQPPPGAAREVTFTKHVAPILQRSCENCHRPDGVAPMALRTYEEVRPWARAIKQRTGMGPRAGVMPPWYVEKNIGIQHFKNDPSLSAEEIALDREMGRQRRAARRAGRHAAAAGVERRDEMVDRHARSRRAHHRCRGEGNGARLVGRDSPRRHPALPRIATSPRVEIKEVNDVGSSGTGRETVGGRYVFHHMIWSTRVLGEEAPDPNVPDDSTSWPVHEVGREADIFDAEVRAPAEKGFEHRVGLGAPALERPRHHRASRDRVQVHAASATNPNTGARPMRLATAWTSTFAAWRRTSSCTPTRC